MTFPAPDLNTDQTDDINAALAAGDTVWPSGRYRADRTVRQPCHGVHLSAHGVELVRVVEPSFPATQAGARELRGARHFEVTGDGCTVEGMTVVGLNTAGSFVKYREAQHAFHISGTHGTRLLDVTARAVHGDGLYVGERGESGRRVWTTRWEAVDCQFEMIGRQGVGITASRDGLLLRPTFNRVARSGVDIEPQFDDVGCVDLLIVDGKFVAVKNYHVVAANGKGDVRNIRAVGNRSDTVWKMAIKPPVESGARRSNVVDVDNMGDGASNNAPHYARVDGLFVCGSSRRYSGRQPEFADVVDCTARHVLIRQPDGTLLAIEDV